ncbi:MAG TPA: N-acetyl-gamma-glutamyl-phosphate reductase [Solirubrobacteraceae bacterium]|nr:N-acetyl-gamma-glutamyl-phosphate reductase [Solirubrobacteraceae bacterium]
MGERVAVVGAAGYAGAVASALLHRHPHFELAHITARSEAGAPLSSVHPRTRVPLVLEPYDPDRHAEVDAAVVAYPHGAAAPVVAELRERGVRVVDLSADFRLHDRAVYEDWYGEHGAPALVGDAVYGLPELHRDEIAGADLVANPGCYPTAAILALAPLARAGLLGDVVIDAKSGISGAGREPTHGKHFVAVDETVTPYKVGRHRHTPEIEQELGGEVRVTFTPHLVPLSHGELVSCYVTPVREADVAALYAKMYAREPWVEVVEAPPGMQEVRETNFCRISLHADERTGRIIVFATIDNLWKGTSSQAIQNLNLMFNLDESEGLA